MNLPTDNEKFAAAQAHARREGLEIEFLRCAIDALEAGDSAESAAVHGPYEWDLLPFDGKRFVLPEAGK